MNLDMLLDQHLGFATRRMLKEHGVTAHELRKRLDAGALLPVGRTQLRRPTVDPDLLRAFRMRSRVTCITAAQKRELWVIDDGHFHVAPRVLNSHFRADVREPPPHVHWTKNLIDPTADQLPLASLRSMLAHIAGCQPLEAAVAVFDSALNHGLITIEELKQLASAHGKGFDDVLPHCSALADSGLETVTRLRLRWAGIPCREQVRIHGHRVDLLIGERLIVQLDGIQHLTDPKQLVMDREYDRMLRRLGYTVVRFGYADVMRHWDLTFAEITALIAQRAHLWS
ncbi:MAG: endonuclease domain-containing protein [Microbacteriaceae bacterium]|nr:endonuclease domain-containing protein [Microbacteriaceae bacterium]MCL2794450.1 endonuclease domain-containing protein [Microbacteriaceae bacterium]